MKRMKTIKHGHSNTQLYQMYAHMKARVFNKKNNRYHLYEKRSTCICKPWLKSFMNFYNDVIEKYTYAVELYGKHRLTLERIDNNGDYLNSNCTFIPTGMQSANKINNHRITYRGSTMILSHWARKINIPPSALEARLRRGWTIERALTKPLQKRRKKCQI